MKKIIWRAFTPIICFVFFAVSCTKKNHQQSAATALPQEAASLARCTPEKEAQAGTAQGGPRIFVIVLENTSEKRAYEMPFLQRLAKRGAYLNNYSAITHPSQPNYLAMIAGEPFAKDNRNITIDARHLGDLIDAAGKTWKAYAEGYPGGCFLGGFRGFYSRKHVPFLSFNNVQNNSKRCAQVVSHCQLLNDIAQNSLPDFALYIPDNHNNGHDYGVAQADQWLKREFGPLLENEKFMRNNLVVVTFDESSSDDASNKVYTALLGERVRPGSVSTTAYDHYDLLRTIEKILNLGSLNRNDAKAKPIEGIWKEKYQ